VFDIVSKMRPANTTIRKQLQKWLTDIRSLAANREEQKHSGNVAGASGAAGGVVAGGQQQQQRESVRDHVMLLLDRWLRVWNSSNDQVFGQYLQLLHQYGVLKTEEAADRFFRLATEICVEACVKSATTAPSPDGSSATSKEEGGQSTIQYTVIDALSKLFLLLVRLADKEASDVSVRINLLNRILNSIARTLLDDHETKKHFQLQQQQQATGGPGQVFDQRPYYRLFSNLMLDLGTADSKQEPNPSVLPLLQTYYHIYLALQPSKVPGFAFGWLQLVSHKSFMPHLLLARGQKGWPHMHRLLLALLHFMQPFLRTVQMNDPIRQLYKGTLKVLLVLLHDFPEFLCDYHLSFCEAIPHPCVQLRNLVLSAFPRSMRLPDPFTPNLKIDLLPEIGQPPRVLTDFVGILNERGIRQRLDAYLAHPPVAASSSKEEFMHFLLTSLSPPGGQLNTVLTTSVVMFVATHGIAQQQQQQQQQGTKPSLQLSVALDIFQHLVEAMDAEGRYHVLNVMVNQLRYPNNQTHYFSCVLLTLFQESTNELLQEQVTRVLLERLIVHRPHPWGLLVTFIELIKNPCYNFWHLSFTHCAPEIERVFESVARSCIGPSAGVPGGGFGANDGTDGGSPGGGVTSGA
jgi:CCR4-NOT transcription complex subunit 1